MSAPEPARATPRRLTAADAKADPRQTSRDAPVEADLRAAARASTARARRRRPPRRDRHRRQRPHLRGRRQPSASIPGTIRRSPMRCSPRSARRRDSSRRQATIREALIEDFALAPRPTCCSSCSAISRRRARGGQGAGQGRAIPDGDAATLDVLAALQKFGPVQPDPKAFLEALGAAAAAALFDLLHAAVTPGEVHLTVDVVRYPSAGACASASPRPSPTGMRQAPASRSTSRRRTASLPRGSGDADHHGRSRHRRRAVPLVPAEGAPRPPAALAVLRPPARERFLLRDELEAFLRRRHADALSTAWSRDGEGEDLRQDRMREAGAELGLAARTARISTSAAMPSAWPRTSRRRSSRSSPHGGLSAVTAPRAFVAELQRRAATRRTSIDAPARIAVMADGEGAGPHHLSLLRRRLRRAAGRRTARAAHRSRAIPSIRPTSAGSARRARRSARRSGSRPAAPSDDRRPARGWDEALDRADGFAASSSARPEAPSPSTSPANC